MLGIGGAAVIWVSVFGIVGRFFVTAIIDRWGRRMSGGLCCLMSAAAISVAGQKPGIFIGSVSLFYIMILITGIAERDGRFESTSLQRGVCELSVPCRASNFRFGSPAIRA